MIGAITGGVAAIGGEPRFLNDERYQGTSTQFPYTTLHQVPAQLARYKMLILLKLPKPPL
eukprot:COSAG01_NODE_28175_length_667_cov_1.297535_1_plen_59_part_10